MNNKYGYRLVDILRGRGRIEGTRRKVGGGGGEMQQRRQEGDQSSRSFKGLVGKNVASAFLHWLIGIWMFWTINELTATTTIT